MSRLPSFVRGRCLWLALGALGALLAMGAVNGLTPRAAADTPTGDPSADLTLSQATLQACQSDASSADCVKDALADINSAHAAEGVSAMALPSDWSALSVPQQLLVVSNLERTERGLIPALGLSAPLDADAARAAINDEDPMPTNFYGDYATSNWEGGYPSALEADFVWMYDDGYGSANVDCTTPGAPGCWGHRHDILATFDSPLVMGAASQTGAYGASLSELFVGGDQDTGAGQPDAPLAPTWSTISALLPGGAAAASGPGQSKTGRSGATGTSGSHRGSSSRRAVTIITRLTPRAVRRGHTVRIAGTVAGWGSSRHTVWLERRHGGRWVRIASARVSHAGRFSLRFRGAATGVWRFRVTLASASTAAASSRVLTLRVT